MRSWSQKTDSPEKVFEVDKIKLEGIKLSGELLAVIIDERTSETGAILRIFKAFNDHQINLIYLSTSSRSDLKRAIFSVDAKDQYQVEKILKKEKNNFLQIKYIWPAGLVTIFNHKTRLEILGQILKTFGKQHIAVYGSASSLSSLSFIVDYNRMDKAVAAIRREADICSEQIYP